MEGTSSRYGLASNAPAKPAHSDTRRPLSFLGRRSLTALLWGVLSWTVLIGFWELSAWAGWLNEAIFPPPSRFVPYFFGGGATIGIGPDATSLGDAIVASFLRVGLGLACGLGIAFAIGVAVSIWKPARLAILPIVRVLAPVAPIAWIPLGLSLFGIGNSTAVFIVTLGVVFILTIATIAAIDGVDKDLVRTARSLGASGRRLWTRVVLPAAAPQILTMVRLNFFAAWMAVLAAEMVGLRSGLGAVIIIGREQFDADLILIGIVVIGVCGFLADSALLLAQRKLLWWGQS